MIFENLHNIRDLKIELVGEDKECILKNCSNLHNILITGIEDGQFNTCNDMIGVSMAKSYQSYLEWHGAVDYNIWIKYNDTWIREFLKQNNIFQVKVLMYHSSSLQFGMFSILDEDEPLSIYYPDIDRMVEIEKWKPSHIMLINEPV